MNDRYLVLPEYTPAGLSNQRMELEIKIGLAHLARRTLVLPDSIALFHDRQPVVATFTELFDLPGRPITMQAFAERCPGVAPVSLPWQSDEHGASSAYFVSPALGALAGEIPQRFANGRRHVWTNAPEHDRHPAVTSSHRMLGWYSHFFLVAQNEFLEVRDMARQITPKTPYRQFADDVALSLGSFNAIHVRRGDFLDWWAPVPAAKDILRNIFGVMSPSEPLLICTDGSADTEYFQPFFRLFPKAIFLHEWILQEPAWAARLNGLPFGDQGVLGLLTQLIAAKAHRFAGTLFSTFSGYVHRQRLFERNERTFNYVFNPFTTNDLRFVDCAFQADRDGPFSWNRLRYPLPPAAFSWFREWPEALAGPFPALESAG